MCLVSVQVVHPYSCTDTFTAWKKSCFILSKISNFHMIDNQSITVYTFARYMLTSLSVDEILLLRYVNMSTNFRGLPLRVLFKIHVICFICIHIKTNAFCWLLQTMQWGFGWSRCVWEMCLIIWVVCICYSFCRISSASYLFF